MDFQIWRSQNLERFDHALEKSTPSIANGALQRFVSAMKYAIASGGKRIRPLLVYATFELAEKSSPDQRNVSEIDLAAVALELIHTYSLVHDDLPSMDNDDLRRGKPTTHIVFDEATAILAGDALQSLAFEVLSSLNVPSELRIQLIQELAKSAGVGGMCGGQAIDLENVGKPMDQASLVEMHRLKTGALLKSAVRFGAVLGQISLEQRLLLDQFSENLGLGFQVIDDILDVTQNSVTLGKTAGKDQYADKPTFVSLMGLMQAKEFAKELEKNALNAISGWNEEANALRSITKWVFQRSS